MDKLKAMQTFIQIADAGSLTAAAQTMDSSLPAVVRSLSALENMLGVRLFNRSTRRIALTEEGHQYLQDCRAIVDAVDEAEANLANKLEEPSGLLTITASVALGEIMVTPIITQLVQHHPKVRCNLLLLDRVVNLLEEEIDIGVRVGELQDSNLIAQKIGSLRRVLVATPAYLKKYTAHFGEIKHPRDLLQGNCIGFNAASGNWWSFFENGKQFTVPVAGNLEFNNINAALKACLSDVGFGIFILQQVASDIAEGKLILLLEDFELPPRPIHLIYPHGRLLPSRTKLFIELMKSAATI